MTINKSDRILITGGNGFVGKHLVKEMRETGYTNLLIPHKTDFDLLIDSDVSDLFSMKIDAVIHLAASVGGIGANRENPGRFFYENIKMGVDLIEMGRLHKVKKFIQLGTVCAYPKVPPRIPFMEEDLWEGWPESSNAPYGIAKKALLVMLQSYRQQYGFNGVYLIPTNMYGEYDNFSPESSHVIPALILKIHNAKQNGENFVKIWGTGAASRDFIYAGDCAKAIRLALERCDDSEPINIGTGYEVKISELVNMIATAMNFRGDIVWESNKPDGQPRRCLNTTKAYRKFGFWNETKIQDGLKKTVEWFVATQRESFAGRIS